jgi:hypothetical protein
MSEFKEPNFEGEEMRFPEGTFITNESNDAPSPIGSSLITILSLLLIAIFAGIGYWYYLVMVSPSTSSIPVTEVVEVDINPPTDDIVVFSGDDSDISESDELSAIEADLLNTDIDILTSELDAIEAELNEALNAI